MNGLALPLLLLTSALPAPVRAPLPLAPRQVQFVLATDATLAAVFVSLEDRRVSLLGHQVLAPTIVLAMLPIDGRFVATLALPPAWDRALHWQAIATRPDGSLWFSDVCHVSPDDGATVHEVRPAPTVDNAAVADSSPLPAPSPAPSPAPALKLSGVPRDDGMLVALHASFLAPTDGYALRIIDVIDADGDDNAEVYLYRQLPGKAEDKAPSPHKVSLTARLPHGQDFVDVYLAEGKGSRPGKDAAFRFVARVRK